MNTRIAVLVYLLFGFYILTGCGDDEQKSTTPASDITASPSTPASSQPQAKPATETDIDTLRQRYKNQALTIVDVSERQYDGGPALAIMVSTPLSPNQTFTNYLSVSTNGIEIQDGGWILDKQQKTLYFPHVESDTQYTIKVYPGIEDINAKRINKDSSYAITTQPIQPSVTFKHSGAFLPLKSGSGLPVSAINIDRIDMDFYRIAPEHLKDFITWSHRVTQQHDYYALNHLTRLGDLVYTGRFDLFPPKNKRRDFNLPVNHIDALKPAGVYFTVMRPSGTYNYDYQTTYFAITDLAIQVRAYANHFNVFTQSLSQSTTMPDVKIEIYDHKGTVIESAQSGPQGYARFNTKPSKVSLISASIDDSISILNMQWPALDLNEYAIGKRPAKPSEVFIYSPRDLYRPGETLVFSALARDHDGNKLASTALSATLLKPDGQSYASWQWAPGPQDYFEKHILLDADVPTGNWQLKVVAADSSEFIYPVKIEEFLPERMTLEFSHKLGENPVHLPTEAVEFDVQGDYLYGAPAGGNRLGTLVQVEPNFTPLEQLKGFHFGDATAKAHPSFEAEDIFLDEDGKATLSIASRWKSTTTPLTVSLVSSLYESGGRPVTRKTQALVWPSETLLGIRPHFKNDQSTAEGIAQFDLIKAKQNGDSVAGTAELQLIREDRQYYWQWTSQRGWHWQYNEKAFSVYSQSITLASEPSRIELPVDYGHYRLEVRDNSNNQMTSYRFHAGENWYYLWRQSQRQDSNVIRPDIVTLALDKGGYQPGDTAKLSVKAPQAADASQAVNAVVMVEADELLYSQSFKIGSEGTVIDIPIAAEWQRHDTYISVVALTPPDKANELAPKRAIGLIHLPLDRQARTLNTRIIFEDKIEPNQTVNATIEVDANQTLEEAYVTLAAVDSGVLSISRFETPNPIEGFFGQRRYLNDMRDNYHLVIAPNQLKDASLAFGGDADLSQGGEKTQADVQIVSLFSGPVALDEQGKATIPLDIPDFNGELRLMALSFDDDQYGFAEHKVKVAAPVVTQISMPRFLGFGDASTLALDIQNLSGQQQQLTIDLAASEPIKLDSNTASITLDDLQKSTLFFDIQAMNFRDTSTIRLTVSGEQINDFSRQWRLGVRSPYPAVTRRQHQLITQKAPQQWLQSTHSDFHPESMQISLNMTSQPPLNIADQLQGLLRYPYGCLEQTSSRAYPWVYANHPLLKQLPEKPLPLDKRSDSLQKAIQRLSTFQRSNGGFGLWSNTSPEEHWLTVYVSDFLLNAREEGVDVPQTLLDNALQRLTNYTRQRGHFVKQRWSDDANYYSLATKAYASFVLSRVNKAPLSQLRTLYQQEFSAQSPALPLLHIGIALERMGDIKNGSAAIERAITQFKSEFRHRHQYLGDYGSIERDMGMAIHLLIRYAKRDQAAQQLASLLADKLPEKQYLSTQERNALFLAGTSLADVAEQNWTAQLLINKSQQQTLNSGNAQQRFRGADTQALNISTQGEKGVYSTVITQGYPKATPAPYDNKLSVRRDYYDLEGKIKDVSKLKVGELVIVGLSLSAQQRTPDALVVDLLPAGLELENQNMEDAIDLSKFSIDGQSLKNLVEGNQIKHMEYRDDRFVAALDLKKYRSSHVFYLARALTPGTYQIPPSYLEDMYRPDYHSLGNTPGKVVIERR